MLTGIRTSGTHGIGTYLDKVSRALNPQDNAINAAVARVSGHQVNNIGKR